jgi:hypothetical protein
MTQKFNCPNCGAPIEYAGEQETVTCSFCNSQVRAPAEILQEVKTKKLTSQAKVWLIVFLLIILVPTCIGFGGTILGVLGGLLGTLVGILAPFMGR